jgi:hypothetical protein
MFRAPVSPSPSSNPYSTIVPLTLYVLNPYSIRVTHVQPRLDRRRYIERVGRVGVYLYKTGP